MSVLAKRPTAGGSLKRSPGERRTEVLAFQLENDTYGVRIAHVAEILKPPPITPIPRAPTPVLGLTSVRGRLVTVIDLRRRFGHPATALGPRARILLTDAQGETLGVLVDVVRQVYRLGDDEIEPPGALGSDPPPYVLGVARPKDAGAPGDIVLLLDLAAVIKDMAR